MPFRKITKNFVWNEVQCSCGCEMPLEVYDNLQVLFEDVIQPARTVLGVPFFITSGYRCPDYNKRVKGARKSQHILGCAVDIQVKGIPIGCLCEILDRYLYTHKHGPGGLGYYPNQAVSSAAGFIEHIDKKAGWGFIHIDIRNYTKPRLKRRAARW